MIIRVTMHSQSKLTMLHQIYRQFLFARMYLQLARNKERVKEMHQLKTLLHNKNWQIVITKYTSWLPRSFMNCKIMSKTLLLWTIKVKTSVC